MRVFNACSNGGRQALVEAQRYPGDYDGIIAGAPASYWTHLLSNAAWGNAALLKDSGTYIPQTCTWPVYAYPAIAHYKRSGSTDATENFACRPVAGCSAGKAQANHAAKLQIVG
jgi:hypothetical protein